MPLPAPPIRTNCCLNGVTSLSVSTAKTGKEYSETGFIDEVTCLPVLAESVWVCGVLTATGNFYYIDETGEYILSNQIIPAGNASKTCERADVLPLLVTGAAGPFTYAELLAQALAAAPVNYATYGAAAATDEVLAINIAPTGEGGTFTLNGVEVGGVNDGDGVNLANVVTVPAACEILVSFCLQKCLNKAEIAAL